LSAAQENCAADQTSVSAARSMATPGRQTMPATAIPRRSAATRKAPRNSSRPGGKAATAHAPAQETLLMSTASPNSAAQLMNSQRTLTAHATTVSSAAPTRMELQENGQKSPIAHATLQNTAARPSPSSTKKQTLRKQTRRTAAKALSTESGSNVAWNKILMKSR